MASQIIHANDVKTDQRPEMLKNERKSHSSLKSREGSETTDKQMAACQLMYHVAMGQQTSHSVKEGFGGLRSPVSLKVTVAYRIVLAETVRLGRRTS